MDYVRESEDSSRENTLNARDDDIGVSSIGPHGMSMYVWTMVPTVHVMCVNIGSDVMCIFTCEHWSPCNVFMCEHWSLLVMCLCLWTLIPILCVFTCEHWSPCYVFMCEHWSPCYVFMCEHWSLCYVFMSVNIGPYVMCLCVNIGPPCYVPRCVPIGPLVIYLRGVKDGSHVMFLGVNIGVHDTKQNYTR